MNTSTTAYGFDSYLEVVERGTVSPVQALTELDQRLAKLRPAYETGEEAIQETTFGLTRGKDEFVELCIHAHDHVSCAAELPSLRPTGLRRFLGQATRMELEFASRDEATALLMRFFEMPEPAFAAWLRDRRR